MLRRVPTGTSDFLGTIVVSTISPSRRANLTWLPRCPISTNPASSRRRLISRNGSGLSRPNLNLDRSYCGRPCGFWFVEMKFERLFEIRERLFFGLTLAGDFDLQALRDVPLAFLPNS